MALDYYSTFTMPLFYADVYEQNKEVFIDLVREYISKPDIGPLPEKYRRQIVNKEASIELK